MLKYGNCSDNNINPRAVYEFIDKCERENISVNSFMLVKDETVVASWCRSPYTPQTKHVMYSISKTVTAIALGYAVAEGKISLDDSICKYYGEYDKLGINKCITIRHLVTMTAGKMIGMAKSRHHRNWVKIYFNSPLILPPGKMFMYVNDNYYLLSAIISKVYKQSLVDFLYPRLFEPLGIEKPIWETDRYGAASGGWGLYLKTEDLAKIMVCYSKKGMWEGKQVIPREWVNESSSFQTPTVKKGHIDNTKGYGYGLWMTGLPNTYRAYGLFGQFGYVFGGRDTVLAITGSMSRDELISDAVNEMYKTLWDEPQVEYEEKLAEKIKSLPDMDNLCGGERNTQLEKRFNKKALYTHSTSYASMLNATMTTVMNEQLGYIDRFSLSLDDNNDLYLMWKECEYVCQIKLGMNNEYAKTKVKLGNIEYTACAKAGWTSKNQLTVLIRFEEASQVRRLIFDFSNKKRIKIQNDSIPDLPTLAAHYMNFSGIPLQKDVERLLIKYVAPAVLLLGEPNFNADL